MRESAELGEPPLEQPSLGVVVRELERASVGLARLRGAAEPAQQLAARRVQVAVVVEREAVDDARAPASGPSASATATARLSSTTGEPVRRASSA